MQTSHSPYCKQVLITNISEADDDMNKTVQILLSLKHSARVSKPPSCKQTMSHHRMNTAGAKVTKASAKGTAHKPPVELEPLAKEVLPKEVPPKSYRRVLNLDIFFANRRAGMKNPLYNAWVFIYK